MMIEYDRVRKLFCNCALQVLEIGALAVRPRYLIRKRKHFKQIATVLIHSAMSAFMGYDEAADHPEFLSAER
jgi:hypothetical protein